MAEIQEAGVRTVRREEVRGHGQGGVEVREGGVGVRGAGGEDGAGRGFDFLTRSRGGRGGGRKHKRTKRAQKRKWNGQKDNEERPPNYQTTKLPNPKGGWREGGRRGKAVFQAGGFALDGRDLSIV